MDLFEKGKSALEQSFAGRLFYWVPVLIGSGILLYFSFLSEPDTGLILTALIFLGALAFHFYHSEKFWALALSMIPFLILLGVLLMVLRVGGLDTRFIEKEGLYDLSGTVENIEPYEKAHRVVLRDVVLEEERFSSKIRLQSYHAQDLIVGDKVSALVKLRPPSAPVLPGGFDFRRYAFFREWGGVGFTLSEFQILEKSEPNSFVFFKNLRKTINSRLDQMDDPQAASISKALITGQRNAIDEDVLEAIRDAGIAHLLAISGLHIGLVSGFVFFTIRFLLALFPYIALRYPIKKIAAIAGFAAAVFYMLLVGAPLPTQRAVLMSGLVFLAILLDRSPISFRLAAFAALVIMALRPESIVEVSFQLSFAAVLSLIAFYEWLYRRYRNVFFSYGILQKLAIYFVALSLTTVIASIATAPLTLYHFQHFAAYSNLSNLVAVPLVSFIVMPFGILALLLMPLGLEHLAFMPMEYAIEMIVDNAFWVTEMEGAVWRLPHLPVPAISLFIFGALMLLLTARPMQYLSWLLMVAAIPMGLFLYKPADILISDNGKLVGFHHAGELSLNQIRSESYVRENWAAHFGRKPDDIQKAEGCGKDFCVKDVRGKKVIYLGDREYLAESCQRTDLLLLSFPLDYDEEKECKARYILHRWNLWRGGSHAIWLGEDKVKTMTVTGASGDRPWAQ